MSLAKKFVFTIAQLKKRGQEENLPTVGSTIRYYDLKEDYLVLDVHPSGKMVFKYYRKLPGMKSPYRKSLCSFSPKMPGPSLEAARNRAKQYTLDVLNGVDLRAAEKAKKAEVTFAEWFEIYAKWKTDNRSWDDDKRKYKDHLKDPLGNKKLNDITQDDIEGIFRSVSKSRGNYAGNRLLSLMRAVLERAYRKGRLTETNPAKGVDKNPEYSRERKLEEDEMVKFFTAVMKDPSEDVRDAVILALLTPARKMNILGMRWGRIYFARATWTIPKEESKAKQDETHVLVTYPLSVLMLRLVNTLGGPVKSEYARILRMKDQAKKDAKLFKFRQKLDELKNTAKSEFVFASDGATGHLVDIRRPWDRIRKAAGVTDLHFHDLRRTNASYQVALGASLPMIGGTLGHQSDSETKKYARMNLNPLRDSLENAAKLMMKHAGLGDSRKKGKQEKGK